MKKNIIIAFLSASCILMLVFAFIQKQTAGETRVHAQYLQEEVAKQRKMINTTKEEAVKAQQMAEQQSELARRAQEEAHMQLQHALKEIEKSK